MSGGFPIQECWLVGVTGSPRLIPNGRVPWPVAEIAYVAYAERYGTDQSLARLAERGGFDWREFSELFAEGWSLMDERNRATWRQHLEEL